ncbi:MAG: TerB family tellurite resistance protein [Desulfuromonadales bacterium]|nr:TerB family tellurite resistance protein [Desulfuromonadales bacterium]
MISRLIGLLKGDPATASAARFDKVQIAVCALLLEVAHSDGSFQEIEARVVHDLLAKRFNLAAEAVAELVAHAQDHRAETHDLFQFAREINGQFTIDEKLDVMEGVWRLIYADGSLDKFEDALARQLATLLRLSHKDVIDRKLKVLEEVRQARAGG